MPIPSRDRLPRPVDISTLYRGAACKVDLIVDQPGFNWKGLSRHGLLNVSRGSSNSSGTGRAVRRVGGARCGRSIQRPQFTGQENRTPRVIVRQGVNWPSWYRRRPLQDITALMEAIEKRRAELNRTREAQQEEINAEPRKISVNELEQEIGSQTPLPAIFAKAQPSPGTQAWNKAKTGYFELSSDFLTPEKGLLNSIDKLRGVWLEDQKRLARTLEAKKADREKKVRTLMSMR